MSVYLGNEGQVSKLLGLAFLMSRSGRKYLVTRILYRPVSTKQTSNLYTVIFDTLRSQKQSLTCPSFLRGAALQGPLSILGVPHSNPIGMEVLAFTAQEISQFRD